jgi:tRNA-2-methylthio-N6-dimethylallyladenosine synthase
MNEYDTEIVKTILSQHQYTIIEKPEEAEVIFLNTCSVRENAHLKVRQRIHLFKKMRTRKRKLVLGVLGCMAQSLRQELLEDKVGVDLIAGPDSYKKLPEMLQELDSGNGKEFALSLSEYETYSDIFPQTQNGINAWIAVMRGCDNFCSFCIVPYTRGRERSRDPQSIVREAEELAQRGVRQITLLGQNVNSYRFESSDFADLMEMVAEIPEIKRIRFTSPHPKDFPDRLIRLMKSNSKICKHIHLPLQAGASRILELMNRTYSKEDYLQLANRIRREIPEITLTTDIIIGFPTETDADFEDTLQVMRQVEFDAAFMFKYSERPHTIAARRFPDDVPEEVKTARIVRLVALQKKLSLRRNKLLLGKTLPALVQGRGKKPGQLLGRSDGNIIVVFPDNGAQNGDLVHVTINEVTANTLLGFTAT